MLRQAAARLRPRTLTQLAGHSPTQTVPSGHRIHRQSARWRLPTPPPPTPSTNKAPPRQSSSDPRSRLLLSYHDLERALERRGLNTFRVLLATSAAGLVAATLAWPRIKQWGAVEGAEVAAASLETERLQETAGAMVVEVLADEKTAKQVEMLLGRAVVALFEDKKFTGRAVEWAGAVLAEAVLREEVVTEGARYVQTVFAREDSKESIEAYLAEAVANVAANETVQDTVAQGLWTSVRASLIGRRRPRGRTAVEEEVTPALENASKPVPAALPSMAVAEDARPAVVSNATASEHAQPVAAQASPS